MNCFAFILIPYPDSPTVLMVIVALALDMQSSSVCVCPGGGGWGCKRVEFERAGLSSSSAHENSSRVEFVKPFELKSLAQARLITIRASSRDGS
jgi:hypothetical protein